MGAREISFEEAARIVGGILGEQTETGIKKGRGRAKKTLALAEAMFGIAAAAAPITGRGIGYKLFARGFIKSMSRKDMQTVYRLLKEERERGEIPWVIGPH
jgi:hypothetical protein